MKNKMIFGFAVMFLVLAMPAGAQDISVEIVSSVPGVITTSQEFNIAINVSNLDEFDPARNIALTVEDMISGGEYQLINQTNISVLWSGGSVLIENIKWNINQPGEHLLFASAETGDDTNPGNNMDILVVNYTPNGVDISAEIEYDDMPVTGQLNIVPIRLRNFGSIVGSAEVSLVEYKSNITTDLYMETVAVDSGEDIYIYANWTPPDRDIYRLELSAVSLFDVNQGNNFHNKTITVTELLDINFYIRDKNSGAVASNIYIEIPNYLPTQYVEESVLVRLPDTNHTIKVKKQHENGAIVLLDFIDSDAAKIMRLVFEDMGETGNELEVIGFVPDWNYSGVNIQVLDVDSYFENVSGIKLYTCPAWDIVSNACSSWQKVSLVTGQTTLSYSSDAIQGIKLIGIEIQAPEPPPATQGTPGSTGTTPPPSGGVIPQTPNTANTTNTINVTANITVPITNRTVLCAEGDKVCAGNSLQTCENNVWAITECPNGCDALTKRCKESPGTQIILPEEQNILILIILVIIVFVIVTFLIKMKL